MQPNTNPTPKQRFQADKKAVENHRSLMQRDDLQRSIDFALLEYQHQVALRTNEQMSGSGHFRMLGALEFIGQMKNLAETYQAPTIVDRDNLKKV